MNHTSQHLAAPSMRPSATFAGDLAAELHRFDEHLRDVRGLSTGTRHQRASIVGRLLQRKFADRPIDIARLRPEDIRRFLADQLDVRRTPSNASRLASALRSYFRYRTTCGDQVGGLTAVITNPSLEAVVIATGAQARRGRPPVAILHDRSSVTKARLCDRPLRARHGPARRRNRSSHDRRR